MDRPAPDAHELARRLLQHEADGGTGAAATAAALERTWWKLSGGLEPLVGRGGADALVTRAVSLARREFPFLGLVRPAPDAPVDFVGLRESLTSHHQGEADAAGAAVVANLLALLTGLLGEDLGLWPIRTIWPDVVAGPSAPQIKEGEA